MVSCRMCTARSMRRSDHPRRPKAITCCLFSSFKTLLTLTEGISVGSTSRVMAYRWGDYLTVMRMDMRDLALWLSRQTGRNVVDVTGLTGRYDIRLDWNRNEPSGTSNPGDPSLFTAIEEQLGLRLAPRKQGVDVLIIDGAEKPGEN